MITHYTTIRFLTPAFLGDAEQNGRWRTPPFKALLRQWWRVVYAADRQFTVDVEAMRREEGCLFGNAWLSHRENDREVADHCKSLVRLRLDQWDKGRLNSWAGPDASVPHPEVQRPVGSQLYLGYGPLTYDRQRRATTLKANAAIQAEESATLRLAIPTTHPDAGMNELLRKNVPHLQRALWLMDRYGTVGSRSRNGWGSFMLHPLSPDEGHRETSAPTDPVPLRHWQDCLDRDWPHAIGQDETGALIWQTAKTYDDWKSLMRDLAIIKIGLRTQFAFPNTRPPHPHPQPRHWLSYPITTHTVRDWQNLRLPNSLRFKIRGDQTNPQKLRGVLFHMPCAPPSDFRPDRSAIESTWKTVHTLLDELGKSSGNRSYGLIADQTRRSKLKPELDKVLLERIEE